MNAPAHLSRAVVAAAVVATLLGSSSCGGCEQAAGDATRLVPADAELVVIVPSLGDLRDGVAAFVDGVEGTSGALDLFAGRYGVDLASPEGLTAAGLAPASGAALWRMGGAVSVAAGVSDGERFTELVADRLRFGLGADVAAGKSVPRIASPRGAPDKPAPWQVAFGVTPDHVGVVTVVGPGADPVAAWRGATSGSGYLTSEPAARARAAAGPSPVAWFSAAIDVPPLPAFLGPAKGLLESYTDGFTSCAGGASLTKDRLSLSLSSPYTGEGTLPIQWLGESDHRDRLARAFPKTTPLLLRFGIATNKARALPGFIRSRILPESLPLTRGMPLPSLSDLIGFIGNDVGVALLGIDPDATVQALINLRRVPTLWPRAVHVALAATLHDPDEAYEAFEGIAAQLRTSSWTVAAIDRAGYRGFSFGRDKQAYSVLIGHDVMIFIIGRGEAEGFLAVAEGRALPLSVSGETSETAKRALGLVPQTAGATLGFVRLTRQLEAKGVPPYFLKIINDLRLVSAAVDVGERAVSLRLEVTQ